MLGKGDNQGDNGNGHQGPIDNIQLYQLDVTDQTSNDNAAAQILNDFETVEVVLTTPGMHYPAHLKPLPLPKFGVSLTPTPLV